MLDSLTMENEQYGKYINLRQSAVKITCNLVSGNFFCNFVSMIVVNTLCKDSVSVSIDLPSL